MIPSRPTGAALWTTRLDRGSSVSLSRQLAAALRQSIAEGSLAAGARLPSSRALAAELGLARSTVVGVFDQLTAEGYIIARPGSAHRIPERREYHKASSAIDGGGADRRLSRQAALLRRVTPDSRGAPRPFETGHVEIDGRLMMTWKRLASRVLSGRSRVDWGYGDHRGEARLRSAITEYLAAARGVFCLPEQIVLTSGTQQGLSLAARVLLDPGDTAWVEDPCYRAALDILRAAEARIVPVAVDDQGLDIAAALARETSMPRLVYTTPTRQYPLGVAMPLPRRLELLAWAEREGVWIVEDDYESEFQRPGRALPSLQGLDRASRVIYLGTFSKLLFPSLRLGYAVLPEDLVEPFAAARHLTDRQSSGLVQAIMTEFILEGHFARHLKRMRAHYAERHAFVCDLLGRWLGGLLDIRPIEPGMYLTATLPPGWDDRAVAVRLAAAGVVALPLSALTLAAERPPGLVLGYAGHDEMAMARAAERMANVLDKNWYGSYDRSGALLRPVARPKVAPDDLVRSLAAMPNTASLPAFLSNPRSRVRRHPERAYYDRETVFAILDAALLCHIGYVIDGRPYVTPTLFWREGERLYWHGSSASRMLRTQCAGIPVCVTVSHVDGLVLARCAFRHSLNYRAVMAFGTAAMVEDEAEKEAGLNAFIERLYPGRTGLMRGIQSQELKATSLISMVIEQASAKIRADGPLDVESDWMADCWAGLIPVAQYLGARIPDQRVPPRTNPEAEVGHFAERARFDEVLLALARGNLR